MTSKAGRKKPLASKERSSSDFPRPLVTAQWTLSSGIVCFTVHCSMQATEGDDDVGKHHDVQSQQSDPAGSSTRLSHRSCRASKHRGLQGKGPVETRGTLDDGDDQHTAAVFENATALEFCHKHCTPIESVLYCNHCIERPVNVRHRSMSFHRRSCTQTRNGVRAVVSSTAFSCTDLY